MSKKRKRQGEKQKNPAEYYKLHTQAVDDLVNANEANSPEVPEEEIKKYRSHSGIKVADWVKILFIKFWFPAAVCYFFIWGLGVYVPNMLDMLVITGIALGMVTDILTNNALRFFARTQGENDRWMMFPKKSYWTFPLNILYAWLVLFLVVVLYNVINVVLNALLKTSGNVIVGVGPILFGLFYMGIDTLLIEAKHLCGRILRDAQNKTIRG